ncbi:MAG: DUF3853 family protein [Fibrobacter sp.]|jgi:hypothetical protein|nr:DUF3853 family protein [Fibrobacter sp.]MBR4152336.1 DUF3853 family protein [Selenomonadaceae bacterium]
MKTIINKRVKSKFVYGVVGLCNLFNCSPSTAWRYRQAWLFPAVEKRGNMIITDVELAVSLWEQELGK